MEAIAHMQTMDTSVESPTLYRNRTMSTRQLKNRLFPRVFRCRWLRSFARKLRISSFVNFHIDDRCHFFRFQLCPSTSTPNEAQPAKENAERRKRARRTGARTRYKERLVPIDGFITINRYCFREAFLSSWLASFRLRRSARLICLVLRLRSFLRFSRYPPNSNQSSQTTNDRMHIYKR